jgi:hypothetical protein
VFSANSCLSCHNATIFQGNGGGLNLDSGDVGARMVDLPSAHGGAGCQDELLIDSRDPENSLLLKLINSQKHTALSASDCKRQPMPQTANFMSEADYACVASWVKEVVSNYEPDVDQPVKNEFAPANGATALAKAKYLLHGGAPTAAELQLLGPSDATLKPEALLSLITEWEQTPEYATKIKDFLALNLQQLPYGEVQYADQFQNIFRAQYSNIDVLSLLPNFNESFVRTAWTIFNNNGDFRAVISSREWEVTTAMLSALVYLEKENQSPGRSYLQSPLPEDLFRALAYLTPEDYNDWRSVKFIQSDVPATWENSAAFVAGLRDIPNGGELALRYPRVGFFSSPVFLNHWTTNDDNQFRVTINQTLIVALNQTFTPADPTPHITENGIPLSHADTSSVCYQCHRHMDPMRLVFDNALVSRYRAKALVTGTDRRPSFSLYGVVENFESVDDLARILSEHPQMPIGWVQKLCVWGNTARCDEADPEFIKLVNGFKNSRFNLRELVRAFFTSPIFTAQYETLSHQRSGYLISMSRGNHFCHAINARIKQINQVSGTTGSINLCVDGDLGVIPKDEYSRGAVDLIQASQVGLFDVKSIDRECSRVATSVLAVGTTGVFNTTQPVDDNLSLMVQYLLGIPKTHHRYALSFSGLRHVFDLATAPNDCPEPRIDGDTVTCGYGLSNIQGLRAAWFAACTSPELIGVGI